MEIICSLSFSGLSFWEFRTDICEETSKNFKFFSSKICLCFSSSLVTVLSLSSEKSIFSWICFCISIISFLILDSKSFLLCINKFVFVISDSNSFFSSINFWLDVNFSSEFCFVWMRFWYSNFRLFVSLVRIIFFSFSDVNFSFMRFNSDARTSLILIVSLIFWRKIWEFSLILLYLSIPKMCLSVSSLTSTFSWMIDFISSCGV